MKILHYFNLLSCSLAVPGFGATNADAAPYPTLNRNGKAFFSVCDPTQLRTLKKQFAEHHYKDDEKVWKVITIVLCGSKSHKNTRYIRNILAEKLEYSSEYTGQDNQPKTMKASKEVAISLFAEGIAYDASIVDLQDGMFSVLFTTNEACGESRTFKYDKKDWIIVATGEACD